MEMEEVGDIELGQKLLNNRKTNDYYEKGMYFHIYFKVV